MNQNAIEREREDLPFGFEVSMRLIKHLQTECILSPELVIILKPNMASQQGDPGIVWGAIADEDGQYRIPMTVNE